MELNDEASDDDDTERGELKILLLMQNNRISTKTFEDTRTINSASKPAEILMALIYFLIQLYKDFKNQ